MDNYFQNCPPKMQDQGRPLSDFQSPTRRNEFIKYSNDIYRDDQYRLFLQKNGKEIMDREWNYYGQTARCWDNDCVHNYPTRSLPSDYYNEMQAYNSIFNQNTNKEYAPLRVCEQLNDYRMNTN
jgi:hypothetical protein